MTDHGTHLFGIERFIDEPIYAKIYRILQKGISPFRDDEKDAGRGSLLYLLNQVLSLHPWRVHVQNENAKTPSVQEGVHV